VREDKRARRRQECKEGEERRGQEGEKRTREDKRMTRGRGQGEGKRARRGQEEEERIREQEEDKRKRTRRQGEDMGTHP